MQPFASNQVYGQKERAVYVIYHCQRRTAGKDVHGQQQWSEEYQFQRIQQGMWQQACIIHLYIQ